MRLRDELNLTGESEETVLQRLRQYSGKITMRTHCPFCYRPTGRTLKTKDIYHCVCGATRVPKSATLCRDRPGWERGGVRPLPKDYAEIEEIKDPTLVYDVRDLDISKESESDRKIRTSMIDWWDNPPRRGSYCPYCYRLIGRVLQLEEKYCCPCGAIHEPLADRLHWYSQHHWNRDGICKAIYKKVRRKLKAKTPKDPKSKSRIYYAIMVQGRWATGSTTTYGYPYTLAFGKSTGKAIALFETPPLDYQCQGQHISQMLNAGTAQIFEVELPAVMRCVMPAPTETLTDRVAKLEQVLLGKK